MEYERIEKVPKGIISPTKLRMKLMGTHHSRKRDGSNGNSSRTSPSRLEVTEETEFARNSLLATKSDYEDNVASTNMDVGEVNPPIEPALDLSQSDHASNQQDERLPRENKEGDHMKPQLFTKGDLSSVHPMRPTEDENLDYDSNASSSSFEFHRSGERSNHNPVPRSYQRPMSSKWNDAEKWIMNRQNMSKKNNVSFYGQGNRMPIRVAPEYAGYDHYKSRAADTKRVDFCQSAQRSGFEKFPIASSGTQPFSTLAYGGRTLVDQSMQSNYPRDMKNPSDDSSGVPSVRSVCMRDMGTEMTPVTSQEPSRTATPVGATTPMRSPTSSIPSTPRGSGGGLTTAGQAESSLQDSSTSGKKELSEQEIKLKTRREIVALGVQLGKMNIAAWASKEDPENNKAGNADSGGKNCNTEELERIEYEKRATAWEEAEKSKHTARYKREEIKIQAWESRQKAKLEAEMRRTEAKVQQMKAQAEAKMVKKIAMARQRSEEKRAAAEARKNRQAEKVAGQAEYIRQTGRIPSSGYVCCGWLS